jgi:hypothetical protein
VKIGTAAWLSLVEVNRYYSVVSNDPEESSLLVPDPTPNAGAYGGGHRNRLTLSDVRHIPSAAPSRVAPGLAREGVDSPQETRLRLLLVLAGLPEPCVNLIIRGRDGSRRRRYDLGYQHLRLIIEYDGRQHAEDTQQWLTDIFRREELDQMHWRLVIITSEGIYQEPLRTLERVRDALLECGAVGIRRTVKPEWRLHFPAR